MSNPTVLILGDSTSMSIGMEGKMYPFLVAQSPQWPAGTRIVNCSLPGITAADACAFFFKHRHDYSLLQAVIIYLGNCDTIASEIRRGPFTPWRQIKNEASARLGFEKKKHRLKNRLLHFEWNGHHDRSIEAPESPEDYEYNIGRVIQACEKEHIPVLLIRPAANKHLPAGLGKGNFVFYRYLNIKDRVSHRLAIEDRRFTEALGNQERGDYPKALATYKSILGDPPPIAGLQEYLTLVVNNYAVCAAEAGNFQEAKHLLTQLLKERSVRKEIVLYNLAQVHKALGEEVEFERRLSEAFEADTSMYRVRRPYCEAVDRLAVKYVKSVSVLDLQEIASDQDYVDHCHPLPAAQERLALKVSRFLGSKLVGGGEKASIENKLYSPELSLGNFTEFYRYFGTYASLEAGTLEKKLADYKALVGSPDMSKDEAQLLYLAPEELRPSFEYYLRSPLFTSVHDILAEPPRLPGEVGRFPEMFLIRTAFKYVSALEANPALRGLFSEENSILRSSGSLLNALPPDLRDQLTKTQSASDSEISRARVSKIVSKARQMLLAHIESGCQLQERLKTTIFWYFRETLRFGSHSRISMRYDRVSLEIIAEALAAAAVLDYAAGGTQLADIRTQIELLEKTVSVHEQFSARFSLKDPDPLLIASYDEAIKALAPRPVPQRNSSARDSIQIPGSTSGQLSG
jgi:tetratricopeptide (TPR) repeat protein